MYLQCFHVNISEQGCSCSIVIYHNESEHLFSMNFSNKLHNCAYLKKCDLDGLKKYFCELFKKRKGYNRLCNHRYGSDFLVYFKEVNGSEKFFEILHKCTRVMDDKILYDALDMASSAQSSSHEQSTQTKPSDSDSASAISDSDSARFSDSDSALPQTQTQQTASAIPTPKTQCRSYSS